MCESFVKKRQMSSVKTESTKETGKKKKKWKRKSICSLVVSMRFFFRFGGTAPNEARARYLILFVLYWFVRSENEVADLWRSLYSTYCTVGMRSPTAASVLYLLY